jgi:glycine hydroxymethyltransferase
MNFINNGLETVDEDILDIINEEAERQEYQIELIASENFVSKAVLEAQGSVLTNKYAEGYSGRRYYSGCEVIDKAENLAIERVTRLFSCNYANVQPHSGSQANQAVLLALLQPGDKIMGMSLSDGGHLTHGASPNLSGKWFDIIPYGVSPNDFLIDYDELEEIALKNKPKLIIAGYSAHPRQLDFKRFREIADKVGAFLMADIAHIAGLVATGLHPSPFPHAHVVTSTTHKTLRGPRGGIILSNEEEIAKKINSALFPGLQGGPLMHVIAAKAVAFKEALEPSFTTYIEQVIKNAKVMAQVLSSRGVDIVSGGTDNHMLLVDLRSRSITGKDAADSLERAGIACNKNAIPFDTASRVLTSGLRLGTPACTSRGFKEEEFEIVANMIADILDGFAAGKLEVVESLVHQRVRDLCIKFPIYY